MPWCYLIPTCLIVIIEVCWSSGTPLWSAGVWWVGVANISFPWENNLVHKVIRFTQCIIAVPWGIFWGQTEPLDQNQLGWGWDRIVPLPVQHSSGSTTGWWSTLVGGKWAGWEASGPWCSFNKETWNTDEFVRMPVMRDDKQLGQYILQPEIDRNNVWRAWYKLGRVKFDGKGEVWDTPNCQPWTELHGNECLPPLS